MEAAPRGGQAVVLFDRVLAHTLSSDNDRCSMEIELAHALAAAVTCGHLAFVQRIHTMHAKPLCPRLLRVACASGDLAMIEWLLANRTDGLCVPEPPGEDTLASGALSCCLRPAYYEALNHKRLHVLRWLFERGYVDSLEGAGDAAAAAGDLAMVQWVHAQGSAQAFSSGAIDKAARAGDVAIITFLVENRPERCTPAGIHGEILDLLHASGKSNGDYAAALAVEAGAAGCLDILTHEYPTKKLQTRWHFDFAMYAAAEHRHVHVVHWLSTQLHIACSQSARAAAAGNGHINILECAQQHEDHQWGVLVMNRATQCRRLNVVRWLHENRHDGCTVSAMNSAAENGHLEVVQWLHLHRPEGCTADAMNGAAGNGHVAVVQWLHTHRSEGCTTEAMDGAAANGYLEVVQWLHWNRVEGCSTRAMDSAAHGGHLAVLEFLHAYRREGCSMQGAVWAATFGHSYIVEWLEQRYPREHRGQGAADFAVETEVTIAARFSPHLHRSLALKSPVNWNCL